jgi:hypothetical protein
VAANSGLVEAPPGLLDREADRLQETLGRYSSGADYSRINRCVFLLSDCGFAICAPYRYFLDFGICDLRTQLFYADLKLPQIR